MRRLLLVLLSCFLSTGSLFAQQKLSPRWEELTADDFHRAIEVSKGTCVLPIGILEKHGPHLPLGTDLLNVRYASLHAAEKEFARQAEAAGLVGTPGHRSVGGMRISLYNAVELAAVEALTSFMKDFQRKRS